MSLALAALCLAALSGAATAAPRLEQWPQEWRDEQGRPLVLGDLAGHRVVLTMAYAACRRICPTTIGELKRAQQRLDARGERAEFVIVGYDPDSEDAATWRQYRASHHLDRQNWHFLSGPREATEQFARQFGFDFWKYDEHVMHGSRVLLFDARGTLTAEFGPETPDWAAAF